MSRASFLPYSAFIQLIARAYSPSTVRDNPTPNSASMIISYSGKLGCLTNSTGKCSKIFLCAFQLSVAFSGFPTQRISTFILRSDSILARARPSPPLLPYPAIRNARFCTEEELSSIDIATLHASRAALSINTSPGIPISSIV